MISDTPFVTFPCLQTGRLTLREARIEDAEDVFSFKSDPAVTAPYCTEPHGSVEQARNWIRSLFKGYGAKEHVMWFITLKNEDTVIGACTLWHLDTESSCGELGYELNRSYWGKGLASEATMAVIKYGFMEMSLNRIEACPFKENAPSNRLLEKLGFTLEGHLRQGAYFRGKFHDQSYYGLLREEWTGNRTQ